MTDKDPESFPEFMRTFNHDPNACPACNGTGEKRWGRLGVRACVMCHGTGKKQKTDYRGKVKR